METAIFSADEYKQKHIVSDRDRVQRHLPQIKLSAQIDNGRQRAKVCILRIKSQIGHERIFQMYYHAHNRKQG